MSHAAFGAKFALCLLLLTAEARSSDKKACTQAFEQGQIAERDGHFFDALQAYGKCSKEECPGFVRTDCVEFASRVRSRQPSIVVAVRDADGRDLDGATATVDGADVALTGKSIAVDPGPHAIVARANGTQTTTTVLVRIGEKDRPVTLTLANTSAARSALPMTTPSLVARESPRAGDPQDQPLPPVRRSYLLPALGMGIGVAALAAGAVWNVTTTLDAHELRRTCAPGCDPRDVDALRGRYVGAAVLMGAGGLVALAGASLLVLGGPSAARQPRAGVALLVGASAVEVRGSF